MLLKKYLINGDIASMNRFRMSWPRTYSVAVYEFNDDRILLKIVTEASSLSNLRFSIFVASRPETAVRVGFRNMSENLEKPKPLMTLSRYTNVLGKPRAQIRT